MTVCEPAEPADGPFRGVPIAVKDLTETAGVRTTYSSRAFAGYVPDRDAAVVRRLREAGFVLLGKTNTCELGTTPFTESELNGACRNPWDTGRTPGGSSGGAAAALTAGLCPVAHGSDGGGSIRIPASCCGLFGLKPSRGRISNAPYGEGLAGLATSGPMTRTVRDAAALLDVMAGSEPGDPWWAPPPPEPFARLAELPPGPLRIALTTEPALGDFPVDAACAAAAREAAHLLEELGHAVEEATPPWREPGLLGTFTVIWQTGPALSGADPALLEPLNRTLAEAAGATSSAAYAIALARLHALARRIVAFWEGYDLVLTPTLALQPVPIGWSQREADPWAQFELGARFTPFTAVANLTGQPAASLPLSWGENGLPIGVQLIGPPAGEALLLQVSAQLEAARPWAQRRTAWA